MKSEVKEGDLVSIKNVEYLGEYGIKIGDVFMVVRTFDEHPNVVLIKSLLDLYPRLPVGKDGIRGVWARANEELEKLT